MRAASEAVGRLRRAATALARGATRTARDTAAALTTPAHDPVDAWRGRPGRRWIKSLDDASIVLDAVASVSGVTRDEMMAAKRSRDTTRARHTAMWLLMEWVHPWADESDGRTFVPTVFNTDAEPDTTRQIAYAHERISAALRERDPEIAALVAESVRVVQINARLA